MPNQQVTRMRIATDAHQTKPFMFQLAGQDPKDSYMTLYTSRNLEKVKEIFLKWPAMAGCRIRVINHNGRVYKKYWKCFRYEYMGYWSLNNNTEYFEKNSEDLYNLIVHKEEGAETKVIELVETNKRKPIKWDLVQIANQDTKRSLFNRFIERMADAVKPRNLKVIKGGL